MIGRFLVRFPRNLILNDEMVPGVDVYVHRKDDSAVICSSRVTTAVERDTIVKMFQDDLDRLSVGQFFRRYVR